VAVGQPGQQLVDLAVTAVNHHVLSELQDLQRQKTRWLFILAAHIIDC
jgi:hypothetical protein